MQNSLRKLAAMLRAKATEKKTKKTVKCAQVAQAATGLTILRRKIGR